jgi:hypothetical protein
VKLGNVPERTGWLAGQMKYPESVKAIFMQIKNFYKEFLFIFS